MRPPLRDRRASDRLCAFYVGLFAFVFGCHLVALGFRLAFDSSARRLSTALSLLGMGP